MQNFSSSLPSRTVISATTLSFAICSLDNWTGNFSSLNSSGIGLAFIVAAMVYFVSSFLKVNMGTCFPTDCIIAIAPIILILLVHWIIRITVRAIDACPVCPINPTCINDCAVSFCYYNQIGSPAISLINRRNVNVWELHGWANVSIMLGSFFVMSVLQFPFDFWQKTTYFIPTIASVWVFQDMMLCPNSKNNFQGVLSPLSFDRVTANQAVLSTSFLIFSLGITWIVTNLLGRRTGAVLSVVLRAVYFSIIFMWTLHALITVRLIILDTVN